MYSANRVKSTSTFRWTCRRLPSRSHLLGILLMLLHNKLSLALGVILIFKLIFVVIPLISTL